nr:TaqI-like C-terminal specificity domain-containing protein [Helicobacter rappini]
MKSKRDFSLFSKAHTKQSLAHTCKNDKNLDSKITHPKPCTHPVLVENLESKAFYESILYFLREYKTHNNNDIKHIILTNTRDFYLIDAREYLIFAKDKTILKAFDNCDKNQGTDTSTSKFYATLKDYLPSLNSTLKFTHFHIQTTPLPLLYQALSPQVLLKQKNCIDANTLNQSFYDELLYILGLKEIDQKGKILILPTTEQNTLLDSICNKLGLDRDKDFETIFSLLTTWNNRILFLRLLESMLLSFKHIKKPFLDIDTLQNFTDLNTLFFDILALKKEKRKTDLKLKDSIPYLNSSLFDKTELEKQNKEISKLDSNHLAIFKHSILKKDKDYKDTQSLPLLEYLFKFLHAYDFTTTPKDIIDHIKTNHDKLINAAVLGLVFEKLNGYKEGSFYTPSFITSYMCKESLEKVVIEKFNERKSWECDSLESLAQKLDKLTDSKDGYKEANAIFDSIKVCDPAVGSGHFLVSMLNAMIELKFRLKILCEIHIDDNGERDYKRLKDIRLRLENDEILIQDSNNTLHTYQTPAHENLESHIIQKALFHNKRILIESCLFGVDINPNSCEITKLRLWIELLKYSFYIFDSNGKNTGDLETLPNIDINIKCGNSLVSNIALDMTKESLEKDLKNRLNDNATLESANEILSTINDIQNKLPHTIQDYKDAVSAYKNETNAELKSLHKQKIHTTQSFIIAIFHKTSKAYQNFKNALSSYLQRYGYNGIDNATLQNESLDSALIKSLNDYTINFNFHKSLDIPKEPQGFVEKELITLIESMREYENLINDTNAFEWRFAFPEVLDSNGDFLGFDLVIGNPPYIRQEEIKHLKPQLQKAFRIYKGTSDIYTYFYEQGHKILKHNGILSFITSNKYCRAGYGEPLREFLLEATALLYYIELNGIKVFDSASVDTSILSFIKTTPDSTHTFDFAHPKDYDTKANAPLQEYITPQSLLQSSLTKESFIFQDSTNAALKAKIEAIGTPLKEWDISINYGIKTGYNEAFIIDSAKRDEILRNCVSENERQRTSELIKPILRGRDIKRYSYEWAGLWIIGTFPALKLNIDDYPALRNYLESYRPRIDQSGEKGCRKKTSNKWFETQDNIAYYQEFEKEKIVYPETSQGAYFMYDNQKIYAEKTAFIITTNSNPKFLLALLNSKALTFYYKKFCGGCILGNTAYQYNKHALERLPIPQITESNKPLCDEIIKCVDKILESKAKDSTLDTKELESQIDSLVYKLYNLTNDEIEIIEK